MAAAVLTGTTRVAVSKIAGGEHFDITDEGAASFAAGAVDGIVAVLSAGLALELQTAFFNALKLEASLSTEMALGTIRATKTTLQLMGHDAAVGGMRGMIEGIFAGALGNIVVTAADEHTYRDGIWNTILNFGKSMALGAGLGGLTGGIVAGGVGAWGARSVKANVNKLDDFLDQITNKRSITDEVPYSRIHGLLDQIEPRAPGSNRGIAPAFDGFEEARILAGVDDMELAEIDPLFLEIFQGIKEGKVMPYRNTAALKADNFNVPLRKDIFVAHSGQDLGKGPIFNGSRYIEEVDSRIFATKAAPTARGRMIGRANDSEVKMFEEFARDLGARPGDLQSKISYPMVTGEITIYSELIPCLSCSPLILQFNQLFPNVKVRIFAQPKKSF